MWLKDITKDMNNVEVFEIFDNKTSKELYDWVGGANEIKKHIGKSIDVVFSGDDYKGKDIWENLYEKSEIVYIPRNHVNISSSEIKRNPYKYFEYLPNCVKPYYLDYDEEYCGYDDKKIIVDTWA